MSVAARRPLVVITDDRFGDQAIERSILEAAGCDLVVAACRSEEDVASACAEADAVLANMAPIGPTALSGMRRCKVVSRYGIGLDNVDLVKAKALGIEVRNVPGYCDDEVAEHALALMFDLARSTWGRNKAVREGRWNLKPATPRIAGSVLGIVGFGGSARALARRALGLGFSRILVWSPHLSEARLDDALGAWKSPNSAPVLEADFDELFMDSDFVSLHLKLTPETRGLVDERTLALMKRGARLINVARGGLVDEAALVAALETGALAGAGLDVFATEPLPPTSPLMQREDVVLSDHAAWFSDVSVGELRRRCAQNALEVLLNAPGHGR